MLHIAWWWDASSLLACFEGSNGGGKEESSSGSGMQRLRSSSERKRPETFFFFSFWRPLNYQSVGEWEPASREVIIPQCVWNLVNARRKPRSFFYTSGRAAQQQRNFFHQMLRRCLIDKKGGELMLLLSLHFILYSDISTAILQHKSILFSFSSYFFQETWFEYLAFFQSTVVCPGLILSHVFSCLVENLWWQDHCAALK